MSRKESLSTDGQSITFVIPAYNSAATVAEALSSIIEGNFEEGDEIVVVDDASTDDTTQIVSRFVGGEDASEIILLEHGANKGTAAAGRNTAIEAAKNDILFCLDSDNVLLPGTVGRLKAHMRENCADAAAFGEQHFFVDFRNVTHKYVFKPLITIEDCLSGHVNPLSGGNYMFTKESWRRAGRYFEPSLENQTLDSWTFGFRQLATGSKMVSLPGTHYLHRYGHTSHYMREREKGSVSLSALIALIPFMHMIEDEDVDYIFSREHRLDWFDSLHNRPVRLKGRQAGHDGELKSRRQVWHHLKKVLLLCTPPIIHRVVHSVKKRKNS